MNYKYLSIAISLLLYSYASDAQVFFGAGYDVVRLSESGNDESIGVVITLQKDFNIKTSKRSINPKVNVGLLYPNSNDSLQAYFSTLGMELPVSYRISLGKRISIAPFAGPFLSWIVGVQDGNELIRSSHIDEIRGGLGLGLELNITITEKLAVKLLPLDYQLGNQNFQQFTSVLLFKL